MIYLYILVMALVTYLIRMIPFNLFQKKIKNSFLLSFLYYVPYSCLAAMIIPGIFYSTSYKASAAAGLVTAIVQALRGKSLIIVAASACLGVFLVERIITLL